MVVPLATPVTWPLVELIVAILVELLVHVPPITSPVSVVCAPLQIDELPEIVVGTG